MIDPDWQPPPAFDEYRLIRPLGGGRMGRVYLAHDGLLDRHVAVKVIPTIDDHALARFLVEARAAARIQHPNVATLYRVGQLDERPYLIYEFVAGKSLDLVEKPMPPAKVLDIAIDLTRGLAAAHRRGVLHRDIKPGNAMLTESGEAKLLDFGIAKLTAGDEAPPPAYSDHAIATLSDSDEDALRELTHGQLLGTPYFMSPEAWRGHASERSDLFSLGLLLYELLAGKGPFRDVALAELPRAVVTRDARPLASVAPAVPEGLAAVVDRCLERDPDKRFRSADDLLARLEVLRPARAGAAVPEGNPYRGLRPFEPEHRAVFFGRARAINQALDRLRVERMVLVTGDSGVGKSSICAAGLLPLIGEGTLEDGRIWQVARMLPGRSPVLALVAALAPLLGGGEDALEHVIRDDPSSLGRRARRQLGGRTGLLLYVDQLEELVTLADPREAAIVSEVIGGLAAGLPGIRVLATARSDFLSRLEALPGFAGRVSRALLLLAPLSSDEVREAIVGPAAVKSTRFATLEMIEQLVESGQGAMPLLQFALAELWERRVGDVIPEEALARLGGISGALSRHADGLLAALLPAERAAARTLLLRLVTVERTRARRLDEELVGSSPHARPALDALVRGRLVVVGDSPEGTVYEIAHEALVDQWDTLARWLGEEEESRALLHRIEAASSEWRRQGRTRDLLWSSRQLTEAGTVPPEELTPRDREFLEASKRTAGRRRWILRGAVIAALFAVVMVWWIVRLQARLERDRQIDANLAEATQILTEARGLDTRLQADRDAAFALYDAGDPTAEAAWADVVALRRKVVDRFREASEPIEAALLLDGTRGDVRRRYGEVLFERAVVAEREHAADQRDEVIGRLALYDPDGTLRARFHAPAFLDVTSDPPGAEVTVRRYARDGDALVLGAGISLGRTPLRDVELAPGSLVLELRASGHAPVDDPVLLARGEHLALAVPLRAAVPAGFVYVPPGRTLFGSSDDEGMRGFYSAAPQHTRTTGGYLIAQHETTYGEWIEFLDALPEAERAAHTPQLNASGVSGGRVVLTRTDAGWTLELSPQAVALARVKEGEKLHYPDRKVRADQDWLRVPVTGISYEDVVAYTSWLDRSGRVTGARPCTELEWERAARGADDRMYPGGFGLTVDQANFDATYDKQAGAIGPDSVGSYPASRSPFGLDDLTGNVWEWVATPNTSQATGARGGAFYTSAKACPIANREQPEPKFRDVTLGVRVCATSE